MNAPFRDPFGYEAQFEREEFKREGDGLGLARALMIVVPICLLFWAGVLYWGFK